MTSLRPRPYSEPPAIELARAYDVSSHRAWHGDGRISGPASLLWTPSVIGYDDDDRALWAPRATELHRWLRGRIGVRHGLAGNPPRP